MKRIPLARVAAFSPFTHFLRDGGCDVERDLSAAGIPPEILGSEESLIPLRPACEFIDELRRRSGIEMFGLEVGSRTSVGDIGIFGTVLCHSLSLKDLIGKLIRWIPALDSGARAWAESLHDSGNIKLSLRHEVDRGRVIADGFALLLLIDAVRMAAGPDWRPKRIWLDRAAGAKLSRFESLSEADADRDVDYVAFEIPREYLGMPVNPPPKKLGVPLVDHKLLRSTAPSEDLVGSILQAIHSSLAARSVTIQHAAEMANTSTRTLQRKLASDGFIYSDLVDRVRFQEARALLVEPDVTLADISRRLGYSDPANFTHAFQRWTGEAPSNFRNRLGRSH